MNHARLIDFEYPPHCHDTWAVMLVDEGSVHYHLDQRACDAGRGTINVLPPHVVHDGRPDRAGIRKRVLYLDDTWLASSLTGHAVDAGPIVDPALVATLDRVHDHLIGADFVAAEAYIALSVEQITARMAPRQRPQRPTESATAKRLRRFLDDGPLQDVSLTSAAAQLDRSVTHLVRSFTATYGISPHAYLTARRVEMARRLLLEGRPASIVALDVGFFDHAHLSRHFRRHNATTPGAYGPSPVAASRVVGR